MSTAPFTSFLFGFQNGKSCILWSVYLNSAFFILLSFFLVLSKQNEMKRNKTMRWHTWNEENRERDRKRENTNNK